MRYFLMVLAFIIFGGCYNKDPNAREPTDRNRTAAGKAKSAWLAANLPKLDPECVDRFNSFTVLHADTPEKLTNYCGKDAIKNKVAGCMIEDSEGIPFITEHSWPLFVYKDAERSSKIVKHESFHYLSHCAGLGTDRFHRERPEVWAVDEATVIEKDPTSQ